MASRRRFLTGCAAALAAITHRRPAVAAEAPRGPLGRPIGLQLYTVREPASADLDGTLRALAGLGYREVETAGFHGRSASEFARLLQRHDLSARAAHFSMFDLQSDLEAKLDTLHALGARYLVCSFPGAPDPARLGSSPAEIGGAIFRGGLTLEEWRWNAEQLEHIGAAAAGSELSFAYHNHAMEFADYDGTVAFDELLRLTDPQRVALEVDCAWVAQAGRDPATFIGTHRPRVRLLHIKDLKPGAERFATVPVGRGTLDWRRVFGAVDPARLDHYFVEQEHFDQPPLDAVADSIRYLRSLGQEAA